MSHGPQGEWASDQGAGRTATEQPQLEQASAGGALDWWWCTQIGAETSQPRATCNQSLELAINSSTMGPESQRFSVSPKENWALGQDEWARPIHKVRSLSKNRLTQGQIAQLGQRDRQVPVRISLSLLGALGVPKKFEIILDYRWWPVWPVWVLCACVGGCVWLCVGGDAFLDFG